MQVKKTFLKWFCLRKALLSHKIPTMECQKYFTVMLSHLSFDLKDQCITFEFNSMSKNIIAS